MPGQTFKQSLKRSIGNMRKNKVLSLLIIVLFGFLLIAPSVDRVSQDILAFGVTVFTFKAESRPQPVLVVVLAIVVSCCIILAATNISRVGQICNWISPLLLVPLIFSKFVFVRSSSTALS